MGASIAIDTRGTAGSALGIALASLLTLAGCQGGAAVGSEGSGITSSGSGGTATSGAVISGSDGAAAIDGGTDGGTPGASAAAGSHVCYDDHYKNVTAYPVQPTTRTPSGIAVDGALDLADLDRRTADVEACLAAKFPDGIMPPELVAAAHCLTNRVDLVVHRDCLIVKVAPDWHVGCAGEEVFPCSVDPALCAAKGLTVTPECPCECRSAIQDNGTIVVTPDLRLYTNDLIRLMTSCNYIWVPGLQECFE